MEPRHPVQWQHQHWLVQLCDLLADFRTQIFIGLVNVLQYGFCHAVLLAQQRSASQREMGFAGTITGDDHPVRILLFPTPTRLYRAKQVADETGAILQAIAAF